MTKETSFEKFISIYNQVDAYMRKALNEEKFVEHSHLIRRMAEKNNIFSQFQHELLTYADLRNVLDHNPFRSEAHPMAEPHEYIVNRYEHIRNLLFDPPKALSIAVKASNIYTTNLDASALEVMQVMNNKMYTHVPVIDDNKMIGVFSENAVLYYLVKTKETIITPETKIKDFKQFITIDKNRSELFEFVPRNALLSDVKDIFHEGLSRGKRIAVVYITETGKQGEKILGMITPWDIPRTLN